MFSDNLMLSETRANDTSHCALNGTREFNGWFLLTNVFVFILRSCLGSQTRPTITKKSKSKVTVVEGNVLYLVCEAEGYPTPRVTWKKNGKVFQTNIKRIVFITDDTSEKDAGKYECEASNSVGTVGYTVEVSIKGNVTRSIKNCYLTRFTVPNKTVKKR